MGSTAMDRNAITIPSKPKIVIGVVGYTNNPELRYIHNQASGDVRGLFLYDASGECLKEIIPYEGSYTPSTEMLEECGQYFDMSAVVYLACWSQEHSEYIKNRTNAEYIKKRTVSKFKAYLASIDISIKKDQ